jgi:DNA-binding CsgD family transcriptional regulator
VDSGLSNRLGDLLKSAARTGGAASGGSILVQGSKASRPVSITATPFSSTHLVTGEQPCALVFLSDSEANPGSRAALLRSLFGLTPAECRLAQVLLEGMDLAAASEHLRVTAATARFMLKRIFNKTACHRQAQLIRLLSLLPGEREGHTS